MFRSRSIRGSRQRGYVLITTAAVAVVLAAFMGLVVDVGQTQYWRRRAQNAADAAGIGAIQEYMSGGSANYVTAGKKDAEANGMKDGDNGVTVTINLPPTRGDYAGTSRFAEAIVTKTVPLSFLTLLNFSSVTVSARAVATNRVQDGCAYALAPTGDGTFSATGSSIFTNNCGIYVRSSGGAAFQVSNSACVTATSVSVVGGANGVVHETCSPDTGSVTIKTGVSKVIDPYQFVPEPSVGGCNHTNFSASGSTTLFPGVYCNGIKLTGRTATLMPGM